MHDVFISYSSEDRQYVHGVVEVLEQRGLSVFWDTTVPTGEQWRDVIGRELSSASCVLVLWSSDSRTSKWVLEEAQRAEKRGVLLPFRLDNSELPFGFGEYQAAGLEFRQGKLTQASERRLVDAVRARLARPDSAAADPLPGNSRSRGSDRAALAVGKQSTRTSGRARNVALAAAALFLALLVGWLGLQATIDAEDRPSRLVDTEADQRDSVPTSLPVIDADADRPGSVRSQLEETERDPPNEAPIVIPAVHSPEPKDKSMIRSAADSGSFASPPDDDMPAKTKELCNEKNPPIDCLFNRD